MPSLMAILGLDASRFHSNLEGAKGHAKEAGSAMSEAFGELGGKLAAFVSIGALEEGIRKAIEYSEQVENMSNRLGLSTDAVQQWDYALRQNGGSIDSARGFFEKLSTALQKAAQGNETLQDNFKNLGVTMADVQKFAAGKLGLEDIGFKIATKVEEGDVQKLIADLRAVGGRGAGELVAAFKMGLGPLLKEAPVAGEPALNQLKEMGDASRGFWALFRARGIEALAGVKISLQTTGGILKEIFFSPLSNREDSPVKRVGEFLDRMSAEELARQAKKKKVMRDAAAASGEPEPGEEAGLSAAERKQLKRLQDEAGQVTVNRLLAEASAAEKLKIILIEIATIKEAMAQAKGPLEKAQLELDLAKAEERRSTVERETSRESKRKDQEEERHRESRERQESRAAARMTPAITEHQRIGAFTAASAATGASVLIGHAAQSTHHLANIEATLKAAGYKSERYQADAASALRELARAAKMKTMF